MIMILSTCIEKDARQKDRELQRQNESASIIQQAWHRFKCKLEFKNKCAERIQKAFRRRKLKIKKREELKLKIRAVGLLQKAWREHRTKRRMCRKRKGENTSMYPDKIRRVESLWSVDDRDFKYLVKVQKLGEGGFGEVGDSVKVTIDIKYTPVITQEIEDMHAL
ncbi:uncharacterized protein LOC111329091 [Stylophora pistillata]|uniref:uncharacterized protein LOC111329091 n=1 Tax=Stylophora pistillata TaxID=50429 RepID=UPI000C04FD2C|nr:uncharacterized protein LOC111329091 [Stylophora pistillata]